jgi:hypothetical protein
MGSHCTSCDSPLFRQAAIIQAATARAMIRTVAMQAANSQYPQDQPYTEQAILAVIHEEGIDHNSVISALNTG